RPRAWICCLCPLDQDRAEPKVTRRKGERVEHELRKTKVKEPRSMSTISSVSPVLFGRHGGVGAARVLSLSHSHFAWREGGGGEGGSISKPVAARMTESAPRLPRSLRT
ncbi:mCG146345, partial [Mus musculus]